MKKKRKVVLTDDERELENSIAAGEWSSASYENAELYRGAAKTTIAEKKKEARVNIRMTAQELTFVKIEAERQGIPYQTLMSSVLHRYLTGQLVDRKVIDEIKAVFKKMG